ncbi:hypothetical protein GGR54DRAFT_282331 [Hypoxylon sp. NC1633]|nr:hypothetical protein GGR54DRAFT_282331 [Hypoxylon sp. NC1633]
MSPSLASQCRRAAHRHLRPQSDSIWIPEALVTAAFERFCVTSRAAVRYGSSTPGPLESRRRMGKRHMGQLNFGHSHSAAPLWDIGDLADLTKWRWKPPSSSDSRQHQSHPANESNLPTAVYNWLFRPAREQPLPEIVWDIQSTPSEVIGTALDCLYRDLSSDSTAATRPNFGHFCDSWSGYLADGLFSGEAICSVLDGIQRGLSIPRPEIEEPLNRTTTRARLSLLSATIIGLSHRGFHEHNYTDRLAWANVLHGISALQMNSLRVFAQAMDHIPGPYLSDLSAGLVANLYAYLTALGRTAKRSSLTRQASKMAESLKKLDFVNLLFVLESGTQYVLKHKISRDLDYARMRLSWLQLLVRLPAVDGHYLKKICCILEAGIEVEPLSNRDICEIYLARCRASTADLPILYSAVQDTGATDDSKCYGSLCIALWKTSQFDHIKDLCRFLDDLGREQDVIRLAKGLRNFVKNEVRPLASLAIAAGEPEWAIDIFCHYERGRGSHGSFWRTAFSAKALKFLTKSQFLKHDRLLHALRMRLPGRRRSRRWRRGRGGGELITASELSREQLKTARVAMALASSGRISNRTALRLISQCVQWIAYLGRRGDAALPDAVLRSLLFVITRDLAEGKPGRTARIRWFLYVLRTRAGSDKMVQVGLALKQWRKINRGLALEQWREMNRAAPL